MPKPLKTVLFFAFAFFCFGATAEAQVQTPILQGSGHYYALPEAYPDGELWKSGMTWEIWGNLYYSKTNTYDVRVGGFTPKFSRAGFTIQPFTLSYAATEHARGSVSVNGNGNSNTFYANYHLPQDSTRLTLSFPEHTIPKFAPNTSSASVTVRFFMQGNITYFSSYTQAVPPQHPRSVSGHGTATLTYYRYPAARVMAFRFLPNAKIYLGSVNFTFDTVPPPPPQKQIDFAER
ncbi:MAG: hypothetical protein M3384_17115 [Acidobacteriota bacterium]|nr:hypothetical protein [Acidobacteriota bacterium]